MNSLEQLSLVTFEQAKKLYKDGFDDINVNNYYHINSGYEDGYSLCYSNVYKQTEGCLLCPSIALALQFYRDVKYVVGTVEWKYPKYVAKWYIDFKLNGVVGAYPSFEEAESALLDKIQKLTNK